MRPSTRARSSITADTWVRLPSTSSDAGGAGARQIMIDLAAHGEDLAA